MKNENSDDISWHINEKWKIELHEFIYQILRWMKRKDEQHELK
jgi:hypothetical protein